MKLYELDDAARMKTANDAQFVALTMYAYANNGSTFLQQHMLIH